MIKQVINKRKVFLLSTILVLATILFNLSLVNAIAQTNYSISGTVFNDFNNNSQIDSGEGTIGGWTINIVGFAFMDSECNTPININITSGANGHYAFNNLTNCQYYVSEVVQNGWESTIPGPNTVYAIRFTNNYTTSHTNVSFADHQYANVSNNSNSSNMSAMVNLSIAPFYPQGGDYVFLCNASGFVPTSYDWSYGDGQTQAGISNDNTYHTYDNDGSYDVMCSATNGTFTVNDSLTINVDLGQVINQSSNQSVNNTDSNNSSNNESNNNQNSTENINQTQNNTEENSGNGGGGSGGGNIGGFQGSSNEEQTSTFNFTRPLNNSQTNTGQNGISNNSNSSLNSTIDQDETNNNGQAGITGAAIGEFFKTKWKWIIIVLVVLGIAYLLIWRFRKPEAK